MLTDRSRQTYAQFKKDKRETLSYNESQVHKYERFVELFILCIIIVSWMNKNNF